MQNISRREALRWIGAGALSFALPSLWSCAHKPLAKAPSGVDGPIPLRFADISPIDRNYVQPAQRYSGDNPDRAHAILWNKSGYLAKSPAPEGEERASVVIVGGGMSGLMSAYQLRDLKPIVLERAERFGGNARGESWQGIDYSIGAAYFMQQEAGTPLRKLYEEIGVYDSARVKTDEDPILFRGKLYTDFFEGPTDPKAAAHFKKVAKLFSDFGHERNGRVYPNIPPETKRELRSVRALDRYSFLEFLEKEIGEPLHPHIRVLLEDYCWSSMGSGMRETSAALGVYFFGGEFIDVLVAPGGNSCVAEKLLARLHAEMPENLRPGSIVIDISVEGDQCIVTYEGTSGLLRRVRADAVIMACPKFVAKHLVNGLEPERLAAIEKLKYSPYLVANVLLNTARQPVGYDTFLLGDGSPVDENLRLAAATRGATDVVTATYAGKNKEHTILTLYRALPYPEGRTEIFAPESFDRYREEFRVQLEKEVLPGLGYAPSDVAEIRLARWGHPLPRAVKGIYRDGTLARVQRPFKERVFFVQQDNWVCAALETCAGEAMRWAPEVRKVVKLQS